MSQTTFCAFIPPFSYNKQMRKKIKRKHLYSLLLFLLIFALSFGAVFALASKYVKIPEKKLALKSLPLEALPTPSIAPTALPTASPTATITLTHTPIARAGFCLNVPVIFYHHIEPLDQAKLEGHAQLTVDSNIFSQQMQYLSSHGYTSYSAEQLVDALMSHSTLPGKPVVVTIDDGYSDTYQFAYPIARQYGIKLSLMIPTGLLENPGYMSWSNLKDMVGSGMVFAYDHTWSHYSLPRGAYDKEEYEIRIAKEQLESHLGNPNLVFAYPYGASNDLSISILKKMGFKGAFTTIPSFLQCDGFIYSLHRNRIGNAALSAYGL